MYSIQNLGDARIQHMNRDSMSWHIGPAVFVILGLLIPAMSASAQSRATGPHTTVTLLANRDSATTGERLWIGLQFQMEKGWHIYWVNPGDSGEPPKVQWQLPVGFHVGEIEWPAPEKLTAPSIVDYGYENEVLLMAPLSVPANLKSNGSQTLGAKVDWLVCREMCIPGKAQLSLTLPVNAPSSKASGAASTAALFRQARARIPSPTPATWKVSATSEKDDFVLTVETGKQETAATFFPFEAEQIKNDAMQAATPFSRGVRLKLQKSDGLLKSIAQLRGVLELGPGRAYQIATPVHAATTGN
ncbi:MAG: protein-disulfide reductase DsbD domain-containing protein [Candidatus Acidiferrales bacterium]